MPETKPTPEPKSVAVTVGRDGSVFDACGGAGRVVGLNPRGHNFLAVRNAPTTEAREIDRLQTGDQVYMCETTSNNRWIGIVYEHGGNVSAECDVTSSVAAPKAYAGPCKSGWVAARYVELFAG